MAFVAEKVVGLVVQMLLMVDSFDSMAFVVVVSHLLVVCQAGFVEPVVAEQAAEEQV